MEDKGLNGTNIGNLVPNSYYKIELPGGEVYEGLGTDCQMYVICEGVPKSDVRVLEELDMRH